MLKSKILKLISLIILVAMLLPTISACTDPEEPVTPEPPVAMVDPIDDNYRTFYQIFVGSFSDSNRDGIGDLRGVIDRMDYLNDGDINSGKSLGIQGIWLSPIFTSPSYHKYDTSDYYKIDWRFGQESDLVELANLCEARNVKLILDLVLNHTSSQHPWFINFKNARIEGDVDNKYYDYYTCVSADERVSTRTYGKIFGIDAYYEMNFSSDMPELNYDNPEVREEMLNVAKYYLDLGVDGFRFDAVKYIYYGDTEKSVEFWEWYMDELRTYKPDIYCVGECWSSDAEVVEYYDAMNCFNFTMSGAEGRVAMAAKGNSLSEFTTYIETYQNRIKEKNPDGMPMPFLSNHDQDRIGGAFVTTSYMKVAANLYLLSPGSPMIYYGEEIGIRGSRGSAMTDANRRLAMLWGDGDLVKNPTGTTYPKDKQIKTTVKDQIADENSLYNYYCRLIAIRHKHPEIARGDYKAIQCGHVNLGGFLVRYNGSYVVIIHNTSTAEATYDLATCSALAGISIEELCDYIGVGEANLNGTMLTISGQTSVILK
jgi:glycosidase